jgi:excisionase family DNA binding protein
VVSRLPLGVHLRGAALWVVWQTARDSLRSRLRQLEMDPYVHRDVVGQLGGVLAELELGAPQFRDWESARRSVSEVADSVEVPRGGSDAGLRNPPNRWVDVGEVAAVLNCSARWVTALCQQGRLAAVKVGRSWSIDPESVRDFKQRGANAAG